MPKRLSGEFAVCYDWGSISKLVAYHQTADAARADARQLKQQMPTGIEVFVVRNITYQLSVFQFYV